MCEVVPAFFTVGFCILEHPGASLKPLLVSILLSSSISTHTLHGCFYFISLLKHVSLGYFRCLMLWFRGWRRELFGSKLCLLLLPGAGGLHLRTVNCHFRSSCKTSGIIVCYLRAQNSSKFRVSLLLGQ